MKQDERTFSLKIFIQLLAFIDQIFKRQVQMMQTEHTGLFFFFLVKLLC